jgi:hypothetical protein
MLLECAKSSYEDDALLNSAYELADEFNSVEGQMA